MGDDRCLGGECEQLFAEHLPATEGAGASAAGALAVAPARSDQEFAEPVALSSTQLQSVSFRVEPSGEAST